MEIKNISVPKSTSIIEVLRQMDEVGRKSLLVFDEDKFYSIVTIGDLQRAIIHNVDISSSIEHVLNISEKLFASTDDTVDRIRSEFIRMRAEMMPVLDSNGNLVKVYFWSDFFSPAEIKNLREKINLPVVIMAGGKGARLKPITNVLPKPLIPIGDKTILEEIMDQFERIGCHSFYMSVNYKSDMIRFYLGQLEHKYNIYFFEESQPLGTIGSVSLLKGKINTPFFISNCDIIIDQDYRDVYDYHRENQNDMTIVTAIKSFRIPYGVVETGKDGLMLGLKEKPETTYMINTGVYILNPECIEEIPENIFFHITHLMEKIKERGGRVGCFPVSEYSWKDMGEWPEYFKMINVL